MNTNTPTTVSTSNHITIHHDDCNKVLPTIADASVDLLVSDPPFSVGYTDDRTTYDDSEEAVLPQIPKWFTEWQRVLKTDSYAFLFTGVKNIEVWITEGKKAGFTFKNIIATRSFNNGSACGGKNFAFVLQPVLLFAKGSGRKFNEVRFFPTSKEWLADKRNKNPSPYTFVYPNFIPTDIAYGTETFGGSEHKKVVHPNAKSVPLERFFIEIATETGDVVLDPFMGSGTTGVAAMDTSRRFIGIEQDERFFKAAQSRIENANPLFATQWA